MHVGIHANAQDIDRAEVGAALRPVFAELSERLTGEYGGIIEHLWIDMELINFGGKPDGSPRHPFRFQKRVSGRSHFGLPPRPDTFNVGHFSVRPDFAILSSFRKKDSIRYALSLIYQGTEVLLAKQQRLGGFDAPLFRERFSNECKSLGFRVEA